MSKINLIALISICVIFLATMLGSAFVFLFRKNLSARIKTLILGFAGGIMIAAAFFGLIIPAIEECENNSSYNGWAFIPPVIGFILGGLLLYALDKIIPHFHKLQDREEGRKTELSQNIRFFLAVTIHNIPEGLAVGFACGLAISLGGDAGLTAAFSALSLAIGIAIQNIPEGAAISVPMYGDGMSKKKAFTFGMLSGVVEPIFAVIAIFLSQLSIITPWLLAFAAGAMIYVTLDEIMPESRENGFTHSAMWSFMIGFAIMMILEMTLG